MPSFWELTTQKGKENLAKKARELGMLDFNPDVHRDFKIKVQGKLENLEEIDHLMRGKPGFEHDR